MSGSDPKPLSRRGQVLPDTSTVVVGFDDQPASSRAVVVATAFAVALGYQLCVVHVADDADLPIDPDSADYEQTEERNLAAERQTVEHLMAGAALEWTYRQAAGGIVAALSKVADELDAAFVVVGATGRGLARLLHTSTPASLARGQVRPVLVVPAADQS